MFQSVSLVGRIASVAETRTLANDRIVTTFNLITSKYYNGEEHTQTHRIVAWGKGLNSLFTKSYLKGDAVAVTGEIEYGRYEKDGRTNYTTDIVLSQNSKVALTNRAQANRNAPVPADTPAQMEEDAPF